MTPSYYAMEAKDRGLDIITWTLERSGPGLSGYYWASTENEVELTEGDQFSILHVLSEEVGILGIFSDWPATVTFYANCMDLNLRKGSKKGGRGRQADKEREHQEGKERAF
jgi:glycerophosphoryl diester phosphodiesterase